MRLGVSFLILLAAAGGGWKYRAELRTLLEGTRAGALVSAPETAPATQIYRWVDDKGVTHFEEGAGKGQPVKMDGGDITPIEPLGPGDFQRAREPGPAKESAPGGQGLNRLRDELKAGAERIREGRVATTL